MQNFVDTLRLNFRSDPRINESIFIDVLHLVQPISSHSYRFWAVFN